MTDKVYLCECNGKNWLIHGKLIECTACGRQYYHLTDERINEGQSVKRAATPNEFNGDRDHWKHDGDWINDEWVPVEVRNVTVETDGTESTFHPFIVEEALTPEEIIMRDNNEM